MNKSFRLSKNKTFELQLDRPNPIYSEIFKFYINWSLKGDHAGFKLLFSVYKLFFFCLDINDNRHWDYDNDCWVKYNGPDN